MAKTRSAVSPAEAPTPPEYTVVARRYRPQQFADLIGQEHVAQSLANAFASGRIAHAYLFTGARGTGKTSTARILAKALNCEQGRTATPCDVCDICKSIAAGEDVDVVEIDASSNTGVDNIRELRQNVGFRPQRARYKVYIIDEVHMLSNSAFNALLKTLEEPPPHVKFIFATTEAQKIPITILSRCQRFDFAHIGPVKVFESLKHIAKKEGFEADEEALRVVARRAAGSMRDAQTLLDQLLGSASGPLTAETVHTLLGTAGDDRVLELADAILTGDAAKAVEQVSTAADRGLQIGELADQLLDYWRGLMLVAVAGLGVTDLPGTPALQDRIRARATGLSLDAILAGLDVLTSAKAKMRGSPHAQVLLEVAVVRLSRLNELLSIAELAKWVSRGGEAPASRPGSTGAGSTQPVDPSKKNSLNRASAATGGTAPEPVELKYDKLDQFWPRLLESVGMVRGTQLKLAHPPAIIGPNSLVIRFPTTYTSAYDACASEVGSEAIRAGLKRITGREWAVRFEKTSEAVPVAPESDRQSAPVASPSDRRKDLLKLPLFQKAAEALGAQIVRVEEGFNPVAAVEVVDVPPVTPDPISEVDEG